MTRLVSVAEAKAKLSEILNEVSGQDGAVIVARRGKPIAVIRRFQPGKDDAPTSWFDELYGALAEDPDFERVMKAVVRSRARAGTRRVNLEE